MCKNRIQKFADLDEKRKSIPFERLGSEEVWFRSINSCRYDLLELVLLIQLAFKKYVLGHFKQGMKPHRQCAWFSTDFSEGDLWGRCRNSILYDDLMTNGSMTCCKRSWKSTFRRKNIS